MYNLANFRINCAKITKFELAEKIINIYENEIAKVKTIESDYSIIIGDNTLGALPKKIKILCPKTQKIAIIFDKIYQQNLNQK